MSSHPVSLDSEEGRSFLQERVARMGRIGMALGGFFWVGTAAVHFLLEPGAGVLAYLAQASVEFHALAVAVGFAVALVAARGSWSVRALIVVDAAFVVLSLGAYAGFVTTLPEAFSARPDMVVSLIAMLLLTSRAILVPSSPRRTLVLGVLGAAPAFAAVWVICRRLEATGVRPFEALAFATLWYVASVGLATLASQVIFGLRAQVAEAQRLGQYILVERVGAGGMGIVYRARHALLRRPTAIKLLPNDTTGAQSLARFEREVQLTSRLTHPNTVIVFDYGRTPEGVFYYAMEYLEGIDLEALVERHGPQPAARVAHLLVQICGSLAEAHGLGLVHRDVKPANVFLCERGGVADVVKVLDFGLVKETKPEAEAPLLSHEEAVLGTPMYLAPEAMTEPEAVDARSDLYALGAVAYRLLTGRHVFEGRSLVEICAAHLHREPAPPSTHVAVPAALERIVLDCLAKRQEDRPASAHTLRERLLGLDLAPWTEADARGWWDANALQPAVGSPVDALALTVDLRARAPE